MYGLTPDLVRGDLGLKRLVEDWVLCLLVNLGVHTALIVRADLDVYERVTVVTVLTHR